MTTVPGPKNRPTIAADSAPEFAADLDTVSQYAADYGNYLITDSDSRPSIPSGQLWPGLMAYEVDTQFVYVRTATAWIRAYRAQAVNKWSAKRTGGTSDSFGPGSFAALVALLVPAAQAAAGSYMVGANFVLKGNTDLIPANFRFLVGATSVNDDSAYDVGTARQQSAFVFPYTHPGGDLNLTLLFQISSGVGTVYKAGTSIWAQYVGP